MSTTPSHDNSFFTRLKSMVSSEWTEYCEHDFVKQLGEGTLPEAAFREYLVQDYIFLIHFSRAWALAVYKAEDLEDMRSAATTLNALLNHEMNLHVMFASRFGVSPADMEQAPEKTANLAYTRFVLERGMAGDVLDRNLSFL